MTEWIWLVGGALVGVAGTAVVALLRSEEVDELPDRRGFASLDTVLAWQPEPARILGRAERRVWRALSNALPGYIVLAKIPIARFVRVPKRNSFNEWLNRVGYLTADFVVCDGASDVVSVVQLHTATASDRSQRRHARMKRVLTAAGIRLVVWTGGDPPSSERIREQVLPDVGAPTMPAPESVLPAPTVHRHEPIPLPEIDEIDALPDSAQRDPPPSTWYSNLDSGPGAFSPEPEVRRGTRRHLPPDDGAGG